MKTGKHKVLFHGLTRNDFVVLYRIHLVFQASISPFILVPGLGYGIVLALATDHPPPQ